MDKFVTIENMEALLPLIKQRFQNIENRLPIFIYKYFEPGVTDTNTGSVIRLNDKYMNQVISIEDDVIITSLTVEMNNEDITKQAYTGPFSAEIFGKVEGEEAPYLRQGDSYSSGEITPDAGWGIKSISVEMGDDDITSEALSGHEVSVDAVDGDVAVEVETACEVVAKPFLSRITANGLTLANDRALIRSLHGNTLVWNQMVDDSAVTINSGAASKNSDGSYTVILDNATNNTNYLTINNIQLTVGHKYLICPKRNGQSAVNNKVFFYFPQDGSVLHYYNTDYIHTATATVVSSLVFRVWQTTTGTITFFFELFDLTQMFGAGNEPTLAEFESLYPLGSYAADAGRLLDFKGETLVSKDTEENVLSTITINPTAMYGYLNGEGAAVQIFPSGMRSAGSVFDKVEKVDGKWYARVNIGSVNLGSMTWVASDLDYANFKNTTNVPNNAFPSQYTVKANALSAKYIMGSAKDTADGLATIFCRSNRIYVKDTSIATPEAFKSAMDGVMLNYELATPRTYLLTDEWQQILNTAYQVETGGMEIVLPENGSEPVTSPAKIAIQYGTDGTENN